MPIVTTLEVRGKKFDIDVDVKGYFSTQIDKETIIREPSLNALEEKLDKALKANGVRVHVPLYKRGGMGLMSGAAIGIHAANGNVLIKWSDGKSEQASDFTSFLRISDNELPKAKELAEAMAKAQGEWYEFEKKHTFRPKDEVKRAINGGEPQGKQD